MQRAGSRGVLWRALRGPKSIWKGRRQIDAVSRHGRVDALRGLSARTGLRIAVGKGFVTVELRQLWKRHEFQ